MQNEPGEADQKNLQDKRWRRAISVAILAMMASMVLGFVWKNPFAPVRATSQRQVCISYLTMIHGAKCSWALEHNKTNTAQPTASELYGTDKYIREAPACPAGGTYTLGNVGTKPRCSIKGHTI